MTEMPSYPVFKLIRTFIPNILLCFRVLTIILKIEVKSCLPEKVGVYFSTFQKAGIINKKFE